jgi:hypothetical protein
MIFSVALHAVPVVQLGFRTLFVPAAGFTARSIVARFSAGLGAITVPSIAALAHRKEGSAPLTGKYVAFDVIQSKIV